MRLASVRDADYQSKWFYDERIGSPWRGIKFSLSLRFLSGRSLPPIDSICSRLQFLLQLHNCFDHVWCSDVRFILREGGGGGRAYVSSQCSDRIVTTTSKSSDWLIQGEIWPRDFRKHLPQSMRSVGPHILSSLYQKTKMFTGQRNFQ